MNTYIPQVDKDCAQNSPWGSFLNKVVIVRPRTNYEFSAKLIQIRDNHLVFESRTGLRTVHHTDDILCINEINRDPKRGGRDAL